MSENATITMTESDLSHKAICDLIDESECMFEFVKSQQTGYCYFNTYDEAFKFYDEYSILITEIKLLEKLYNECNDM